MIFIVFLSYFILIFFGLIIQVFIPGFPKELLLIQAGIVFGLFFGTLINWIGMILAAQFGYEISRYSILTGGRFSTRINEYSNSALIKKLEQKGNYGLFWLRLIPYSPNDVLSLLSGLLILPRKGFIIVSIITALPFAIFFAYLGSLGAKYINLTDLYKINILLLISSIIIIFLYYIVKTIQRSKKQTVSVNE